MSFFLSRCQYLPFSPSLMLHCSVVCSERHAIRGEPPEVARCQFWHTEEKACFPNAGSITMTAACRGGQTQDALDTVVAGAHPKWQLQLRHHEAISVLEQKVAEQAAGRCSGALLFVGLPRGDILAQQITEVLIGAAVQLFCARNLDTEASHFLVHRSLHLLRSGWWQHQSYPAS